MCIWGGSPKFAASTAELQGWSSALAVQWSKRSRCLGKQGAGSNLVRWGVLWSGPTPCFFSVILFFWDHYNPHSGPRCGVENCNWTTLFPLSPACLRKNKWARWLQPCRKSLTWNNWRCIWCFDSMHPFFIIICICRVSGNARRSQCRVMYIVWAHYIYYSLRYILPWSLMDAFSKGTLILLFQKSRCTWVK